MERFNIHQGLVAPMDRDNVDTDAIIPKQFLKSIKRSGFGPNLFDEWRYLDAGEPGQDPASRRPNPGAAGPWCAARGPGGTRTSGRARGAAGGSP